MTTTATMTEHIDTRDGWREASHAEMIRAPEHVAYQDAEHQWHYWVRKAPVPPLPTEPYTVIRAKVRRIHDVAEQTLVHMGGSEPWIGLHGGIRLGPVPADGIIGFEVLAEPRAETAKTVLAAVRDRFTPTGERDELLDEIAREFEVEND